MGDRARATTGNASGLENAYANIRSGEVYGRGDARIARTDDGDARGAPGQVICAQAVTQVFQASQSFRSGVSEVRWFSTLNPSASISVSRAP